MRRIVAVLGVLMLLLGVKLYEVEPPIADMREREPLSRSLFVTILTEVTIAP